MKNEIVEYFKNKKLTNLSVDKFLKNNIMVKRIFNGYFIRSS